MAGKAVKYLYTLLVQDTNPAPVTQRRILSVGIAHNDAGLLAALAAVSNLEPDVDAAIGKRPGAKERAAWLSRPNRTIEEVCNAVKKEKRMAVLKVAAARTDLDAATYDVLAAQGHEKVAVELLSNSSVPLAVKKKAAASWAAAQGGRHQYALNEMAQRLIGGTPEVHDAVARAARNVELFCFVAKSELSEASQRRIFEGFIQRAVLAFKNELKPNSYINYEIVRTFEKAVSVAIDLASNASLSTEMRTAMQEFFSSLGQLPKTSNHYGTKNPDTLVQDVLKQLVNGATVSTSPVALAQAAKSAEVLLEFAQKAAAEHDGTLAHAVLSNPLFDAACAKAVANCLGYRNYPVAMASLAKRGNAEAFAVLAAHNPGALSDDVLSAASNPSALLALTARIIADANTYRGAAANLLTSRWCTPEVVAEFPITLLGGDNAPEHVAGIVSKFLVESFGENEEQWQLFELLVEDGAMPLRDLVAAVKALVPDLEDEETELVPAGASEAASAADDDADARKQQTLF